MSCKLMMAFQVTGQGDEQQPSGTGLGCDIAAV